MTFNIDCARDILLAAEKLDFGQTLSLRTLTEQLPNYSSNELSYVCLKLSEAGFLSVVTKKMNANLFVVRINDISYEGHQFLANIRNDSTWQKIKATALSLGSVSIPVLQEVAANYFSKLL